VTTFISGSALEEKGKVRREQSKKGKHKFWNWSNITMDK